MTPPSTTTTERPVTEPTVQSDDSPTEKRGSQGLIVEAIRLIVPLIILAVGYGAFEYLKNQRKAPAVAEQGERFPRVRTVAVESHKGGLDIKVDGLVVPYRDITLSAEIAGKVTVKTAACEAGSFVKAGTPLISVDPRRYALEVKRITNEMNQADSVLKELIVEESNTDALIKLAMEEVALHQRHLKRTQQLFAQNVATDTALDEARNTELMARNKLQTLKNERQAQKARLLRLTQAKELAAARLEQAEIDLANAQIVAPVDGVIVTDTVEQGSYVQPGAPLFTIEDTSQVEVTANLRMEELNWLWRQDLPTSLGQGERQPRNAYELPQTEATVTFELVGREYAWRGFLSRYDGLGLDSQTRTVPCRITVPAPRTVTVDGTPGQLPNGEGPRALVRGMYVTVNIHAEPDVELIRIPERAVRPGNVVWRVHEGQLNIVPIDVARLFDDSVLVEAGEGSLHPGDRLVISPLSVAVEGMAVSEEAAE